MPPRWATVVVRIERLDETAEAASPRFLMRVLVGLDDTAPQVSAVSAADAEQARLLVAATIDRACAELTVSGET